MNSPREEIIGSAVGASGLPGTFAHTLVHEEPWLTCEDEISEEIGQELLAPLAEEHQLEKGSIVQFLNEFNSLVRARINQGHRARAQAFEALSEELSRHGTEAEYEDGDYWLQADDLDIGCVFVEMLGDFRLSDAALENLRGVLERHSQTIRTIRIRSAKGTAVIAIPPQ